jgi:hypothetical protein
VSKFSAVVRFCQLEPAVEELGDLDAQKNLEACGTEDLGVVGLENPGRRPKTLVALESLLQDKDR